MTNTMIDDLAATDLAAMTGVADDCRIENPADAANGWPARLTPRPLRLHTPQVEQGGPGGGLGGLIYSRQFAQYLATVQPLALVLADRAAHTWWASAYGQQRVRRRFVARMGAVKGAHAFEVALVVASGCRSYQQVMQATGHSAGWISNLLRLAEAHAFARRPVSGGEAVGAPSAPSAASAASAAFADSSVSTLSTLSSVRGTTTY